MHSSFFPLEMLFVENVVDPFESFPDHVEPFTLVQFTCVEPAYGVGVHLIRCLTTDPEHQNFPLHLGLLNWFLLGTLSNRTQAV